MHTHTTQAGTKASTCKNAPWSQNKKKEKGKKRGGNSNINPISAALSR